MMFFTLRGSSPRRSGYAQPSVGYICWPKSLFTFFFQHSLCAHSITGGIMANRRVKCKYRYEVCQKS